MENLRKENWFRAETDTGPAGWEDPSQVRRARQAYKCRSELKRLEGTLAGKEWFVPMSWSDQV